MKKVEILSPAGNMECLKAAIEAGCDAVYIGGKLFGARAFSDNFSNDEIVLAIKYAHLYGVKVYVTVNTIIYEREVDAFLEYVDFLYKNNVDALIIQDIGMMDLIRKTYPKLELHASTQMHIHNLEGVKLIESLGLKRIVLARETDIDTIKKIKDNTEIEIEVFVHGALCVSYSGQCLLSSLIGNRSGNRGSCVGSCRLKYDLIKDNKKLNTDNYLLSMKDLNSLENIDKLIDVGIDSFKIEGRMKSKEYVYMVTKLYREAVDSYLKDKKVMIDHDKLKKLKTIFNRCYTKGFLFNEENNNITNSFRPNHLGIEIGTVINYKNNFVEVKLSDNLSINDGIRFVLNDYGFIVTSMFKNKKRIEKANINDIVSIPCNKKISINSKVVKTTDYNLNKEIDSIINKSERKVFITGKLTAKLNEALVLEIDDGKNKVKVVGNVVCKAINSPTSNERIKKQISRLGNTIYEFKNLECISDDNIFIQVKELNDIKNKAIDILNEKRLYKYDYVKKNYDISLPDFKKEQNVNYYIKTKEQYEKIKNRDIKYIYMDKTLYKEIDDDRKVLKLERVINNYEEYNNHLLVGEMGSLRYKDIDTDFSFNVVNSYSVAFLHSMGVKKITLSYELTKTQISMIIDSYHKRYKKHPNLEVIVYGYEEAMICKFNLNKLYNTNNCYLVDRFNNKFKIEETNDLMKIYNYKPRNLEKDDYFKIGINNVRYNYLDENIEK